MSVTKDLPKAELHVHAEAMADATMIKKIATRNGVELPEDLFTDDGKSFRFHKLGEYLGKVYPAIASVLLTQQDFEDITYEYLRRCAEQGCLYVEIIAYAKHCDDKVLTYKEMIDGIAAGIDRAEREHGIIGRINTAINRRRGIEVAWQHAETILSYPHPHIVGLDLVSFEQDGDVPTFAPVLKHIQEGFDRELGMRIHAGESAGPQNIRDAIELLGVTRIGHGIRAVEDPKLVEMLAEMEIVLEVCVTSNVIAAAPPYNSFETHPLRRLHNAGVKVSLATDDPGHFNTTIENEYRLAHGRFGFTPEELVEVTRTAIEASFVDEATKARLLRRIDEMVPVARVSQDTSPPQLVPEPGVN